MTSRLPSMRPAAALQRRAWLLLAGLGWASAAWADEFEGDPFRSHPWPDLRREFLGPTARVRFDERVRVQGPAFAEDPMNVPIAVRVDDSLGPVEEIVVLVDRNPIRKVLGFFPRQALPSIAFRFKLEQASPVRAAARTADGTWVVGGTWVDSTGGGCTVPGAGRKDGSWARSLGEVHARLFEAAPGVGSGMSRLRVRISHPMDTGLAAGIPAFYVNRLSVRDGDGVELARLQTHEPVSENPMFSFDFARPPRGGVRVVGGDNNGNRIDARVP